MSKLFKILAIAILISLTLQGNDDKAETKAAKAEEKAAGSTATPITTTDAKVSPFGGLNCKSFEEYHVDQCEKRTCYPCLCALVDDDGNPATPDVYMCLDYSEFQTMLTKKRVKEAHYGPAP
jgi:hypothetical protein